MIQPLHIQFAPFPVLETERLTLRAYRDSDAPEVLFMRSDPRMMRYIDREPAPDLDAAREHIRVVQENLAAGEGILWAICLKGEEHLIGNVCFWRMDKPHFRAEIGYMLFPDHQGQGLMHEAAAAALDYAFQVMHFHSIEANVNPDNAGSIRVLERLGFVREAYFRENYYYNGKFLDSAIYSLLAPAVGELPHASI
jgi:[ribosomal protein S5]-alanine N-acetyltransferase